MDMFEMLKREHRIIEQVLRCVDSICSRWYLKSVLETGLARRALDFLREFADGCHHHKEEELLFPRLETHGISSSGTRLSRLLDEHQVCRQLLSRMNRAIERYENGQHQVGDEFAALVTQYVPLLKRHIAMEDHDLFVAAAELLTWEEQQIMEAEFVSMDQSARYAGDKYLKVACALTSDLSLPLPDFTDIHTSACHCLNFLKDLKRK